LIVAGRYTGRGSGKLRIEGTVNGQRREFDYEVKFPSDHSDYEFIPRLWATRRVGYLLDEIRLHGDNKELRDEVTDLARKYGIVTPYTSYLIVEDERQRAVTNAFRTLRLEEREDARRDLSLYYESFSRDKSGDLGVAASQSAEFLKRAEAPAAAAAGADIAARRPATLAQSSPAAPRSMASEPQLGLRVQNAPARTAKEISSETRFAGGRAFYRNGDLWVDAYLQRTDQSQPVRLNFASTEYFALLRKHPEVRDWLALGPNVQFVLDGRVYEVRMEN
jgi:Ca-activated chloride channel family protein